MTVNLGAVPSISPQMITSVTVLQYGTQELCAYLKDLSYENPLMELQEPEPPRKEEIPAADRLRWLKSSDRQNRSYYGDGDRDSVDQYLQGARDETLRGYVLDQIRVLDVPAALREAMETVAELLDQRGLFPGSHREIAKLLGCADSLAEAALERVRELEPAGVAAPSVRDALLRQLDPEQEPVARQLLSAHFDHLGTWSDQRLAKALGVRREAVQGAKAVIAALNPYPGNGFAAPEEIQYVTPDLSIRTGPEGLIVTAEERYIPGICVSSAYLRMLETETDPEVQRYLKQKLSQLEQVISDVERRKSTVLRCGEVIARRQEAFFRGGCLRTLTLRDVAEELELHESTVSRAVRNKYVQCSRGLLPMSAFFSRDVGRNVGLSRSGIQKTMLEIIGAENPQKPLSDEKIAAKLAKRRITLSRRAVAKYRTELGVPPASGRRQRKP